VHDVVDEISAAHPGRIIKVDARGSLTGRWDCERITQVLSNLIVNAIEHGGERTVVNVTVHGDAKEVSVAIHNRGPAIPDEELDGIFNAMKRQTSETTTTGPSANLGLGLYIADQIVQAHKGRIEVDSSEDGGTTFTVHLPRNTGAAGK
jgi:signal transduction histidine kinase